MNFTFLRKKERRFQTMISVMQPTLGQEKLDVIKKAFESNWIGHGKLVSDFEKMYAEHLGTTLKHVLSTNGCSEGLFSSLRMCFFFNNYQKET